MKLYTIYDPDSQTYLTRGINPGLDELNSNTRFFNTRSEAKRHLENRRYGLDTTVLQNELAFWLLEQVYETDRWHINVGYDEFMDACEKFNNLKVQCLVIGKCDG